MLMNIKQCWGPGGSQGRGEWETWKGQLNPNEFHNIGLKVCLLLRRMRGNEIEFFKIIIFFCFSA